MIPTTYGGRRPRWVVAAVAAGGAAFTVLAGLVAGPVFAVISAAGVLWLVRASVVESKVRVEVSDRGIAVTDTRGRVAWAPIDDIEGSVVMHGGKVLVWLYGSRLTGRRLPRGVRRGCDLPAVAVLATDSMRANAAMVADVLAVLDKRRGRR